MLDRIPDVLTSRKVQDVVLVGAIMLLGVVSFGLGRLSTNGEQANVVLCSELPHISTHQEPPTVGDQAAAAATTAVAGTVSGGAVVGSRSGSTYHLPWCSGAQRIKEENKVWFASREAAEEAGYHPAKNCKGL